MYLLSGLCLEVGHCLRVFFHRFYRSVWRGIWDKNGKCQPQQNENFIMQSGVDLLDFFYYFIMMMWNSQVVVATLEFNVTEEWEDGWWLRFLVLHTTIARTHTAMPAVKLFNSQLDALPGKHSALSLAWFRRDLAYLNMLFILEVVYTASSADHLENK